MLDGKYLGLREETIAQQPLLVGEFLQVVRDSVRLPDGGSATREYVVHPGAVVIVPLLWVAGTWQIVLEAQYRHPLGRVIFELPAGKIDAGESPLACAVRELAEETGYRASQWAKAGVIHPTVAYSNEFIEIWFARDLKIGPRKLDEGEFLEVLTVTTQEFFDACCVGRITDAKTLCAAMWLQNWLSGAWSLSWSDESSRD